MAQTYTLGNIGISASTISIPSHTTNWGITTGPSGIYSKTNSTGLTVSGDSDFSGNVEIGGDLMIGGSSLSSMLSQIERRLALLQINPAMEAEFDQLRELGDQYRLLEAELLEKKRVWDILKKSDQ
jgi:hypothetical protein